MEESPTPISVRPRRVIDRELHRKPFLLDAISVYGSSCAVQLVKGGRHGR